MKIGFTGTQQGMSVQQYKRLKEALGEVPYSNLNIYDESLISLSEFHHGDCIGADAQAAEIAYNMNFTVVSHPPIIETKRAFAPYHIELPAKPYLTRNHDIVDETDILIATPKEQGEVLRSGTWATIRYAIKKGKTVWKILPDGEIFER